MNNNLDPNKVKHFESIFDRLYNRYMKNVNLANFKRRRFRTIWNKVILPAALEFEAANRPHPQPVPIRSIGPGTTHTPEPWQAGTAVAFELDSLVIFAGSEDNERAIALIDSIENATDEDKANLLRIVECVNAMSGIPDPARFMKEAKVLLIDLIKTETNVNTKTTP